MASKQRSLGAAKASKDDEFYTQLTDIEKELRHYRKHFKGKVVYCNCDDPRESATSSTTSRYNFEKLGLKKLIATCYKSQDVDLFSRNDSRAGGLPGVRGRQERQPGPRPATRSASGPSRATATSAAQESIALLEAGGHRRDQPAVLLFREYVAQLMEHDKKFLIIGNMNAITYKEIFPLIQDEQDLAGVTRTGTGRCGSASRTTIASEDRSADRRGRSKRRQTIGNVCWFTNLDHREAPRGPDPLQDVQPGRLPDVRQLSTRSRSARSSTSRWTTTA